MTEHQEIILNQGRENKVLLKKVSKLSRELGELDVTIAELKEEVERLSDAIKTIDSKANEIVMDADHKRWNDEAFNACNSIRGICFEALNQEQ